MKEEEFFIDIICQVLVEYKSKDLVYKVLNEFIPGYETINLDYTGKPDEEDYEFKSEDEMISCYIDTPNVQQRFYWNKYENNPDEIMVGVNIMADDQMIFSLTLNGTPETEARYYLKLKKFLDSNIGVISYFNPVEYKDGKDFKKRYKDEKYDFEDS